MKTLILSLGFCLGMGAFPAGVLASEFDDADILPGVMYLTFGDEHVGIRATSYYFNFHELPSFVLHRSDNSIGPVSASEYASLFGESQELLAGPYRDREGPHLTTDGTPYTPYLCDRYARGVTSKMEIAGRPFAADFSDCFNVSEIDLADDIVWIGTYYTGSHDDGAAHGLMVASLESGEIAGRIDTGRYPIYNVRYDSVAKHTWAITRDQIVVVNKAMKVVTRYFFNYDFNASTGHPELRIAEERIASHPLAVFALHLPSSYYRQFFESVQTIPDDKARTFSLYDFYMCCKFAAPGEPSRKPTEFEILIPFLLPAFKKDLPRWKDHGRYRTINASRKWRQVACDHRSNAEAARLCDTEDWGDLIEEKREIE